MLQHLKDYKLERKRRHERSRIRRRIKKHFIPLDGSFKSFFLGAKPGGQRFDRYLRRLWRDFRFACRCTGDRIWYGQSGYSYYDLDMDLIRYLRNGIAMLEVLHTGYPNGTTPEAWAAELQYMRCYIDSFFTNEDVYKDSEYLKTIAEWMAKNLTTLWD